jgi:hypothetical protein
MDFNSSTFKKLVRTVTTLSSIETQSERLSDTQAEAYQSLACDLNCLMAVKNGHNALIVLAMKYPTAQEILINHEIKERILRNRAHYYPELDRVISRLMKQRA